MEYDFHLMEEGLSKWNLTLSDFNKNQFILFYEHLVEVNQVMNLTAITEFEDVIQKHFLDSISSVQILDFSKIHRLIDVGTGAGFPGIPLKIMFPQLHVDLLDSLQKRVHFLESTCSLLNLEEIRTFHGRAEEYARRNNFRECYDLCVSRAVANLSTLSEYCLPYVKVDGYFLAYKSGNVQEEIIKSDHAIEVLGGKIEKVHYFQLPDSDIDRSLVLVKKVRPTSGKYPRKAGTPAKEPL